MNGLIPTPASSIAAAADASTMAAIVLAAGESQRMGQANKLLLSYAGRTFLQHAIRALTDAGVGEIVVVLGHDSELTSAQVGELLEVSGSTVQCVVNDHYEEGQMTSVNYGLSALTGSHKGVLICLGDQPLITSIHIRQLVAAFETRQAGKQIIVPDFQGQRGNPVVISEFARAQVLSGDSRPGCRRFIDNNPELVSRMSVADAAYTTDIDTPEELHALLAKHAADSNTDFKSE